MHSLNICHGDIKPDNILLGDEVKITDFGTSRLIEDLFVETIGEGTCGFIAPEVVNLQKRYLSSDIYSLGALLYFLLTGRKVYDSLIQVVNNATYKKPSEINSDIPLAVEEVILKSLARDPRDRYDTVEELRFYFENAIETKEEKISVKSYNIDNGESWLEKVGKLYQAERWQEAEKFLHQESLGEVGPDLNLQLGYAQYKQGKFHTSLQQLKEIDLSKVEGIRRDSFAEELDYLKAKVYTALKEYEQALAIYKRLNDTYSQIKYKYRLAIVEGLCSNLDRAIELLEEINQEYPQRLEIIKKLAYAYDQKKEFEKAHGYFKYLQKLEPNNQKVKEKIEQYDKLL